MVKRDDRVNSTRRQKRGEPDVSDLQHDWIDRHLLEHCDLGVITGRTRRYTSLKALFRSPVIGRAGVCDECVTVDGFDQ